MPKTTKKVNAAFMKPMQPSEQLAKRRTTFRTLKISVRSLQMTSCSRFSAAKNWICSR